MHRTSRPDGTSQMRTAEEPPPPFSWPPEARSLPSAEKLTAWAGQGCRRRGPPVRARARRGGRDGPRRESDAAAAQLLGQPPAPGRQAAGQRALGDEELAGRLLARTALHVAEQDRQPVSLRQAAQLLVEGRLEVAPG